MHNSVIKSMYNNFSLLKIGGIKNMVNNKESLKLQDYANMFNAGNIDFKHPYQRSAGQWSKQQKLDLIDSFIVGFDVDAVTLALKPKKTKSKTYYCIDGVQRISTICDLISDKLVLPKGFKIAPDNILEEDKVFSELSADERELIADKKMAVTFISDWTEDELREVFRRKNNGKPLTSSQKNSIYFDNALYSKILEITNLDEVNQKGKKVKNFWNRVIKKGLRKNSEDRALVMQTLMLLDKHLEEKDENGEVGINTGFLAKDIENYIVTFGSYSEEEQNEALGRVKDASLMLNEQFELMEKQIKDARKSIKNAKEGEDISQFEATIRTNKLRMKSIKKLTIPMLVAGMARVMADNKGAGIDAYINKVYELLDFIGEMQNLKSMEREIYLVNAEADEANASKVRYYKAYNTSGTADKRNVSERWKVFRSFTVKEQ